MDIQTAFQNGFIEEVEKNAQVSSNDLSRQQRQALSARRKAMRKALRRGGSESKPFYTSITETPSSRQMIGNGILGGMLGYGAGWMTGNKGRNAILGSTIGAGLGAIDANF